MQIQIENRKGSHEKKNAYKFWKLLCQPPKIFHLKDGE